MSVYDWYSLIKPSWAPGGFDLWSVWGVLYVLIAISFVQFYDGVEENTFKLLCLLLQTSF